MVQMMSLQLKKYVPEVLKSSFTGTMNITFNSTYSVDILSYVGGLVGYNSCLIEDSFSDVVMTINSTKTSSSSNDYKNYVGGLVGYAKVGNISKSAAKADIDYVSADVTDIYIGGIAGYLDNHAFITNSVFLRLRMVKFLLLVDQLNMLLLHLHQMKDMLS
ncbi:MAG: hypothetical protein L6U99_03465 [Clostridium sp.]|nr:MAG: hypothetical protein L6U99_03465 [Clostridium sp.]